MNFHEPEKDKRGTSNGYKNDLYPYDGLCSHFKKLTRLKINIVLNFLTDTFSEHFGTLYLKPRGGKEGAQKRVEILKQIRKELK